MSEYPKTENLLKRDDTTHKLILGEFRERAFEQVGTWHVTEKIDGTNIRLVLTRHSPGFDLAGGAEFESAWDYDVRGRSDAANLPKGFIEQAVPDIRTSTMCNALSAIDPQGYSDLGMIVYGEGYGPGIQKCGGHYAAKKSLRIFDVLTFAEGCKPLWRSWHDVETVATMLGLSTAPIISTAMSTGDVIAYVQHKPYSVVESAEGPSEADGVVQMEGVVCRTDPYLYDSRGSRVKFKLKAHDLA